MRLAVGVALRSVLLSGVLSSTGSSECELGSAVDPGQFHAASKVNLRRAQGSYWAFLPPRLPPEGALSRQTIAALSQADRMVGEVSGLGRTLPSANLLALSLLRREAVLSSRIEGTRASLSDLVLFEVDPEAARQSGDVQEVANYVTAANHLLDPQRRLPMSLPLLLEAHALLMTGQHGHRARPGQFRDTQNWIGPPGSALDDATFVPPAPADLADCLDALEKYLHATDEQLPPLLRIAAIHYQFEAFHPFIDGNGRIGRLLVIALLVDWGLLPAPLLDISAYIDTRRDAYYDSLLAVSTAGDWEGWFRYFLDAVAVQARATIMRATVLRDLREEYRCRLATPRGSARAGMLVDSLFATPAMTIRKAQELLSVTHRAATVNIEKLVAAGILTEIDTGRRTRVFLAVDILSALSGVRTG